MPNDSVQRAPGALSAVREDLYRLLWGALALFLFLSLVSYSPQDPSFGTWHSYGHPMGQQTATWNAGRDAAALRNAYLHNWFGRTGSFTADLLFQLCGLAAFAVPFFCLARATRRRRREEQEEKAMGREKTGVFLAALAFLFSLAFLLETQLESVPRWIAVAHPGGSAGFLLRRGARFLAGEHGSVLVALITFLAATMVAFQLPLLSAALQMPRVLRTFAARFAAALRSFASRLRFGKKTATAAVAEPAAANLPALQSFSPRTLLALGKTDAKKAAASAEEEQEEEEEDEGPAQKAAARAVELIAGMSLGASPNHADAEELARLLPKRSGKKAAAPAPAARRSDGSFEIPPLTLLAGRAEAKGKVVDRAWFLEKANILVEKLRDFGVEGEVVNISPGPVITVYEFKPASGVKIKEIANLSDDLTLALSVLSVRIVAPIPGKPVVGIEIPSPHRETVRFRDLIEETSFYDASVRIPIVLGRLASGEPVVAGLASMPHLLVAGSTGTGKSVFINTLIASLLYRYSPEDLKLILVDPKMVELANYEGIPHLLLPVVVDSRKAAMALRWGVDEMERRYGLLHEAGVRHIDAYNEKMAKEDSGTPRLPYIVVVIDEYADLMATVPKDVELSITRLAQKARASGIHLVLATQRPSTDVVTGTIKANFPSRISFRVASSVDSKTILDRTGSERLLGQGDMLLHSAGFTTLKRMQGAFLSDEELERIVAHWRAQGAPQYDEQLLRYQEDAVDAQPGEIDGAGDAGELFDRAVRLVAEKGEASISLLQRHLKIGYNRAATLMEEMEKEGIVAQATSASKRRAVLVSST